MGYAACKKKLEMHITFWLEKWSDDLRDTVLDWKLILKHILTFWSRNYFSKFSTPVYSVNKTGTKQVRIMKQTAFWRGKNGEYIPCLKYSVPIFVE